MASVQNTFKKCSLWMRLSICVNIHVKKALIDVLHNRINDPRVQALPSDPADLYAFLQTNKRKIEKSAFIKDHEKSILLPSNSQRVDSSTFDISLARFLIQTFSGIRNAKRDWREPDLNDQTLCACVYRAACLRNAIFHDNNIDRLSATEFEKKWKQLKGILQGLKYVEDIEPFKTEPLDFEKYEHVILEEFVGHLRSYKEDCLNESPQDGYIQRRFCVDGDNNKIVIESQLESLIKNNDRLLIYGEAGMGKSSTARRVKQEWCNQNILNEFDVLYFDSKKINKQLTVQSNAAPLYFSELGNHLRKNGRTEDDFLIYKCVKTTIDHLLILIDGIDEFPIRELIDENYIDRLEKKVMNNEKITGVETISAIYFGFLFPYSKVLLLGRISEFESLKRVQVGRDAGIFNRKNRNLKLLEFDDVDIKDLTCSKICKQPSLQSNCNGTCSKIYKKIKNIELCKNPTDLNSLLELHKKHPNNNIIGKITRTKLIIATIFNRLTAHVYQKNNYIFKTFREISEQKDLSKYLGCIRTLGEISFNTLLEENVTVNVMEERGTNDIVYFKYKNQISIERKILEELDLFYVRDFHYYFILEPHHTLNIEFLSACYLFSNRDKWDSLSKLNKDRQLVIISFIAGFYAGDYFTKDFAEYVLKASSNYSIDTFFTWLYDVIDVHESLVNCDFHNDYDCWYGLMDNQKLSPSFLLIDSISHEVEIPQMFIPTTIVCYHNSINPFEWYDMKYFKHNFLSNLTCELNIESFLNKFPNFKFKIKGDISITDYDDFERLDKYGSNDQMNFKINDLNIATSLDTWFNSSFKLNSLTIDTWLCDSPTIGIIFDALSPLPTSTNPNIRCKRLRIDNIRRLNNDQTKKLFTLVLSGVVDYISLNGFNFFSDDQIDILNEMERKYPNKMIPIEFVDEVINRVFDLPNLGNRHISFFHMKNVTDNNVIKYKENISPRCSNNFSNYKIIDYEVPFVRKENYSQSCEQSMFLNLCWFPLDQDFRQLPPDVFASCFCLIPSLACIDSCIPSSHWYSLSQKDDSQINEMRIWKPQKNNFKHLLSIKTNIQFVFYVKEELKELLDHIFNNSNVTLNKEIKVFVVMYDFHDWDYYEEISLFSGKTIEEYKNNYILYDSKLDDVRVPFYEGGQNLMRWCCEISQPFQKNVNTSIESPSDDKNCFVYELENELNEFILLNETENENDETENQDDGNCYSLKKFCCCF